MKKNKDYIITKAWIGRFCDDQIGWAAPDHLSGYSPSNAPYRREYISPDDEFYLCEVIVKVLKNKKSQYIKRRAKTLGASKGEK